MRRSFLFIHNILSALTAIIKSFLCGPLMIYVHQLSHRWTHSLDARTQWHVACTRSGDRQRPYSDRHCRRDLTLRDAHTVPTSCVHWYAYRHCRGHHLLKLFSGFSHLETCRNEITNGLEVIWLQACRFKTPVSYWFVKAYPYACTPACSPLMIHNG